MPKTFLHCLGKARKDQWSIWGVETFGDLDKNNGKWLLIRRRGNPLCSRLKNKQRQTVLGLNSLHLGF